MSDFDITKTQTGPSFLESLKRRKALGLVESDDEDFIPPKKAAKVKKSKKKKEPSESASEEEQDTTKRPTESPSSKASSPSPPSKAPSPSPSSTTPSNTNPYLASAFELDSISFTPPPKPTAPVNSLPSTQSTGNVIDLSDEEKDDGIGIDDLDPDLVAVTQSTVPGSSTQPEKIVIKIQYTHNYDLNHLTEATANAIRFFEKPIKFKVMDNTQFRILLTNFCATKKFLKMEDVYLTYNDDIVFLSGTPASVGMDSIGTHKMEIYPKSCYQKMMADKEEQKQKERMRYLIATENEDGLFSDDPILNAANSSSNAADPEEARVRLSLRTADNKVMPFRVRATTTLQELVDAFRKRAELTGNVQLSFEGETMDLSQTIEETDLEDEDIVEVITK
ncbi:hypothetical protein HMPREF1544_04896 [Mucor circinelloides 1006PhL]|uniref:Ubiquitin-like domain-containing protein n=1 Tax=Mucor circinelloides f. circinelloides (strain 1006PhL) TaxID=1220926 RepID=S2JIH9_MUCC1|nr:hypothetical protein HMPREF1544_04896 [Mucor circinelloides 1006PhL]